MTRLLITLIYIFNSTKCNQYAGYSWYCLII